MMKIDISKVKITPNDIEEHCAVYKVTDEIIEWVDKNGLDAVEHDKGYLNITLEGLEYRYADLFSVNKDYLFFDGFSPNLNKELHLGHLSNLVYASTISNLCPHLTPISILNDTDDHKDKEKFYNEYKEICNKFNYKTQTDNYSSNMDFSAEYFEKEKVPLLGYLRPIGFGDFDNRQLKEQEFEVFVSSEEDFKGCIVVKTPKTKQLKVIRKSDGSTNYLNQDLDLAKKLHEPILYLTGAEQISHFEIVTEFYPQNKHLAIGLITTDKEKMSSRLGNVTFLKDVLGQYEVNTLKDTFLNYHYKTFKDNLKIEVDLSVGFKGIAEKFENKKLYLVYLNAQNSYNPSLLYKSLKGESENDIDFGLKLLGYEQNK